MEKELTKEEEIKYYKYARKLRSRFVLSNWNKYMIFCKKELKKLK